MSILSVLEVTLALCQGSLTAHCGVCVSPARYTFYSLLHREATEGVFHIENVPVSCKSNISVAMYVLVFTVKTGNFVILLPTWGGRASSGCIGLCVWDLLSPSPTFPSPHAMEWPAVSCFCHCPWACLMLQPRLQRDLMQRPEGGPSSLPRTHQLLEGRDWVFFLCLIPRNAQKWLFHSAGSQRIGELRGFCSCENSVFNKWENTFFS